jgi:hypothetical protein
MHFGASAGRANARRRSVIVEERQRSGCSPAAAPLLAALLAPHMQPSMLRSRLAIESGGQQQSESVILSQTFNETEY